MESFERHDPTTKQTVRIELLDTIIYEDEWDDQREARLIYPDGRKLSTIFWRDPMERGGHYWQEPGMVITQDLTTEDLLAAIDDFLRKGEVDRAFEVMDQ